MKNRQWILMVFMALTVLLLLLLFNVESDYHFIAMQVMIVQIILGLLFYPRFVLGISIGLALIHIIHDTAYLQAFPLNAYIESTLQIIFLVIILRLIKHRDIISYQLEDMIQASRVGTWTWKIDADQLKVNKQWALTIGYSLEDLLPMDYQKWLSFVHEDDRDMAKKQIQDVLDFKNEYYDLELRLIHKNGQSIWVHDRGKITAKDALGKALVMSGTYTNIDEKKRDKDRIEYFHHLMSYVIDHSNSGIAVHDINMNYVYVSQKYLDQYNVKGNIIGKNHYDVFPDLPEKWKVVHKKSLKGQVIKADRDPYVHQDGHIDYTRWESRPWYNELGEIAGIIIYTEVINDFIKIEESLREKNNDLFLQKEKSDATLLAINEGVISTDSQGQIIAFNDIAEQITGYKKEELVGKKFGDYIKLMNDESKKTLQCPIQRVIASLRPVYQENHTVLMTKDHEKKYIEDSASPIKDQNGYLIGVVMVIRDVTLDKQKQREIEYLSIHDHLTGLYNRRYFSNALLSYDHQNYFPLGLMMIDVNGLKIINDAYGHVIGDQVLKIVASVIEETISQRGLVSRIGGDEFTVIISNTNDQELLKLKESIKNKVAKLMVKNVYLSVSIGYAIKDNDTLDISEILRDAENIMYRFKLIDGDSARNQTIQAIHKTLTDKYELERNHSERVAKYSRLIGQALNMEKDALKELELSGMFHDIGKISIPDSILYKTGRLNKEEYEVIKEHTRNGYVILRAAGEYSDLAENALYHHEHYDGKGYPEGLKGQDIPLQARIIGIADAYEAMTADRPYRKGMAKEKAIDELLKYSGSQFDPNLVDIFVNQILVEEDKQ